MLAGLPRDDEAVQLAGAAAAAGASLRQLVDFSHAASAKQDYSTTAVHDPRRGRMTVGDADGGGAEESLYADLASWLRPEELESWLADRKARPSAHVCVSTQYCMSDLTLPTVCTCTVTGGTCTAAGAVCRISPGIWTENGMPWCMLTAVCCGCQFGGCGCTLIVLLCCLEDADLYALQCMHVTTLLTTWDAAEAARARTAAQQLARAEEAQGCRQGEDAAAGCQLAA